MTLDTAGYRQLNLVGFTVDALQPLALFKDEAAGTTFPLWLEMSDVLAITAELVTSRLSGKREKEDLLDAILGSLGRTVAAVLVDGTAESGYRAQVCLDGDDGAIEVRVELVTALLTAIRYTLPVGISEAALASSSLVDHSGIDPADLPDEQRLLAMLERLNPEEMGKYPM